MFSLQKFVTRNFNSTCPKDFFGNYSTIFGNTDIPEWEALLTILIFGFLILFMIIGNILVILSVIKFKPLRKEQNLFIVSLAVADLTVAVIVLPVNVMQLVLGRWTFEINFCKLWLTCDVFCCTASILNLCAIALDRLWYISGSTNYDKRKSLKRILKLLVTLWLLSFIISSPPLLGWNDWPDIKEFLEMKECKLSSKQSYVIYSALGSFYIPLIVMTIAYIQIFVAIRTRLRKRVKVYVDLKENLVTVPTSVYQFVEEKQQMYLSEERNKAKQFGIIMGVFVICWLPFFLMYIITPFFPTFCLSKRQRNFITWLGYINSALNPIIYTTFNPNYRKAFQELLRIS